jgi:hypothetical protein
MREPLGKSLAHLHRGPDRSAARAADQEPLLADQLARGAEAVAVVALHPPIDQLGVEHVGDEVVTDALDLVALDLAGAGQNRALGVDADDLATGQLALDHPSHTADGAAGAGGEHHRVELSPALVDDLAPRPQLVCPGVIRVAILIQDVRVRDHLVQALGDADVRVRRIPGGLGGRADDLGAQRLEHHLLLAAHLLGHGDDHPVALHRRRHRQADARVAAGGFDQGCHRA